ncbi:shufflon system plasmid conjugative transfer pilus tip adhesin PilV, partial [Escherichia coli]|uniref:shufflon system plasmid conjugative transfer pilus tip adhesin PilV n=1 Tax=Escherichia coli TaxID=562 RepID=UPI002898BD39
VKATGNLSAGGVLQLGQVNVAGIACYPNGLISRDASGGVLSCQSGVWKGTGGNPPSKKINYGDADNCVNTYSLVAEVGGLY